MRTIVTLHSGSNAKGFHTSQINARDTGLASLGFNSTNTDIQATLFAKDNPGKSLLDHAKDLVAILKPITDPKVFVAAGGSLCAGAAMTATTGTNIKIVFTSFRDPDPPATNMTGVCVRTTELDETRLRLLHEYLPHATNFGVLVNSARGDYFPPSTGKPSTARDRLDKAASGMKLNALDYQDVNDPSVSIKSAFQRWTTGTTAKDGALVTADPFFNDSRDEVVKRATIPAVYQWREFVQLGGLMSYGPWIDDAYKIAGTYAGRILNGEPFTNLPVVVMTRFELYINETKFGAFPQTLHDRADKIL
jgi:putative ABC transport system substrate-binding protein